MSEIRPNPAGAPGAAVDSPVSPARRYQQASFAPATRAAYRSDLADVFAWLADTDRTTDLPLEPDDVADYLAFAAGHGLKPSTLTRRVAAIATAHRLADLASPTATAAVTRTLSGIRRQHGVAPAKARALDTDDIVLMLEASAPDGPRALRDRALLVLGFAGALRRSELVDLDVADLHERRDGLVVTLRRTKSDQEGAGRQLGIARGERPTTCPVTILRTG